MPAELLRENGSLKTKKNNIFINLSEKMLKLDKYKSSTKHPVPPSNEIFNSQKVQPLAEQTNHPKVF